MPEPQRFFIVHMQKSAGTTLRDRFRNTFDEVCDLSRTAPTEPTSGSRSSRCGTCSNAGQARGDEIRLVAGHFPLCTTELLDVPFITLTVLRPPVERTLSYLRHQKKLNKADAEQDPRRDLRRPVPLQRAHPQSHDADVVDEPRRVDRRRRSARRRRRHADAWNGPSRHSPGSISSGCSRASKSSARELSRRYGVELGEPMRSNATDPMPASAASRRTHRQRQCARHGALRVHVELYDERYSARDCRCSATVIGIEAEAAHRVRDRSAERADRRALRVAGRCRGDYAVTVRGALGAE